MHDPFRLGKPRPWGSWSRRARRCGRSTAASGQAGAAASSCSQEERASRIRGYPARHVAEAPCRGRPSGTPTVDTDDTDVIDTDDTDTPPPGTALEAPEIHYGIPNWDIPNPSNWASIPVDATDDDLGALEIVPSSGPSDTIELTVEDTSFVRIYHDGGIIIGGATATAEIPWQADPIELLVEFGDFNVDVDLTIDEIAGGSVVDSVTTRLRSSPLLLNNHFQISEKVVSVSVDTFFYDNQVMMGQYATALGPLFDEIAGNQYGSDVWVQDEIQFAVGTTPDGDRMNVVIDSIRDRGLDPYPENEWRGEDYGVETWGSGFANSLDSFGNLENSPPVDGYPLGRIYYGAVPSYAPRDQVLFDYLEMQMQAPFQVDTNWLCVGHVDEIMSFVPDAAAPRGFRFIYSVTQMAWDVLEAMDPATPLPRWSGAANHNYPSVGAILADNGLRLLNDDLQADHLDPILQQMKSELGLLDEEIVMIPALFEEPRGCGSYVAALIPGMASLVVVNEPGVNSKIFMADPFVRPDVNDQSVDPIIDAVEAVMPPTVDLWFLDDWETYHLALGEVHCGTNMPRTNDLDWWNHDLGGN